MSTDASKLRVQDLKKELKNRGLDTKGTKAVLLQRLLDSFISTNTDDTLEENDLKDDEDLDHSILKETTKNHERSQTKEITNQNLQKSESINNIQQSEFNNEAPKLENDVQTQEKIIQKQDFEKSIEKQETEIGSNNKEPEINDNIDEESKTVFNDQELEPIQNENNINNGITGQIEKNLSEDTSIEIVDLVNEDGSKDKYEDLIDKKSKRSRSRSNKRKRSRSRGKGKHRSRSRSRSRSRDRKKYKSRDRWSRTRSRDRKKSRSKDRKRSRSRNRRKSKSRDRKRSRSYNKKHSRSRDRKRSRSRSRDRKRTRSRSRRKRSKNRSKSKDKDISFSKSRKSKSIERKDSKERSKSKETEKCVITSKEIETSGESKNVEKSPSSNRSRSRSKDRKKSNDKSKSKSRSKSRNKSRSRSRKRSRSRSKDRKRSRSRSHRRSHSRSRDRRRRSKSKSKDCKRSRSRKRSRGTSTGSRHSRYMSNPQLEKKMESDDWLQDLNVRADQYTMDMYMEITDDGKICTPTTDYAFGYMWAGVRATYGITFGKICFQVKFLDTLDVTHLPESDDNPYILRVGFSTENTTMQLGEEIHSYGYDSTANSVTANTYAEYGEKFSNQDVITAYLDMSTDIHSMSFSKNGSEPILCLIVDAGSLGKLPLFPHVLTKNVKFQLIFTASESIYPAAEGFTFLGDLDYVERVRSRMPPQNKKDCQVLLMCGLPASGKTKWVSNYIIENKDKNFNVIGTAAIVDRMRVMGKPRKESYKGRWDLLIDYATKCLKRMLDIAPYKKRNYIIDQTNVYAAAQRRKMRPFDGFTRKGVVILPPDPVYIERRKMQESSEGRQLSDSAVLEMKANFRLPEVSDDFFEEVVFIESSPLEALKLVDQYNETGRLALEARRRNASDRGGRYDNDRTNNDRIGRRDRRDIRDGDVTWRKPENRPEYSGDHSFRHRYNAPSSNAFHPRPRNERGQMQNFPPVNRLMNFQTNNWRPNMMPQNWNWTPLNAQSVRPSMARPITNVNTSIASTNTTVQSTWTPLSTNQVWQPLPNPSNVPTLQNQSNVPAPWLKPPVVTNTPIIDKPINPVMSVMGGMNAADMTTFMTNMIAMNNAMNMNNPMAAMSAMNAMNNAMNINNQAAMNMNTLATMNNFMNLNPGSAINMMNQALSGAGNAPPTQDQLTWNYNQFMMQLNQQMQNQKKP